MSINLKPHSLECGSSLTVLSFGSSKKQGALQTPTFKWGCPIVFLILAQNLSPAQVFRFVIYVDNSYESWVYAGLIFLVFY